MQELNEAISKIDVLLPPVEYIKNILQAICDHLGYSFASVIEVDDAGEAKMLVSYNLPEGYPERVNEVDEPLLSSPSGEAIESGRIIVITDLKSESRLMPWHDLLQEHSLQTIIWIPLFKKGKAFGTYVLYDTKKRDVSKRELEIFEQIGVMVSIAITSNHYLDELITEAKERKLAEDALTESEKQYRLLFNGAGDAIFIQDMSGRFIQVNDVACERLGYSRDELLQMPPMDIDLPEYADCISQRCECVKRDGYVIFESAHVSKGGTVIPVEINSRLIEYGGQPATLSIARDITERKKAETALIESEKRYRGLFNSASDGIFIHDLNGQFIDANVVACEFLGYTHDELLQMTVMDLHTPQNAPKIKPRLLDVLQHDYIINEANVERDGRVTSLEIKSQLIESDKGSAILSIARDITERRHAEKALKKSEELFRTLHSTMNEGVALHEIIYSESGEPVDYRILDVNPAFESIVGIKREDAVGSRATELYATSEAPYLDIYAKVAASGDPITFESTFESVGKTFKIAVFSPGKGKFATLFADITERKRMEEELKSSYQMLEKRVEERTEELEIINRELSDANTRLLDVDRMKSEFLDTVSHELRTPLTSIIGYSSLLLDGIQGEMNEKQTQYVDGIWRKGMHQLQLVNDILDLSKLESSRMAVVMESVSVSKIIAEVVAGEMPTINDKQHETVIEITDGVGDVCADKTRFKQVLLNLVSNAIKFTPDYGRIVIKAEDAGEMVRISITDNGIGIKEEDIPKLFNRFVQIDQSNTRSVGGTGLGLAIVKDMMELMGGTVDVGSEYGKGTTFSLLFPKAQSQGNDLIDYPEDGKQTMLRF